MKIKDVLKKFALYVVEIAAFIGALYLMRAIFF